MQRPFAAPRQPNVVPHGKTPVGVVIALCYLLISAARTLYFFWQPDDTLIGIVPDDAFYYIQLALHHASGSGWTFDGQAPATGFHLLYAYLLSGAFQILGPIDWRSLFLAVSCLGALACAWSTWRIVRLTEAVSGTWAAIVAGSLFLAPLSIDQPNLMMESWLVILVGAEVTHLVFDHAQRSSLARNVILPLVLGMVGSLSRSDFGLMPAMLCLGNIACGQSLRSTSTRSAFLATFGAALGVGLVMLHTHAIAHSWLQASAQTKLLWARELGYSTHASLQFVRDYLAAPIKSGTLHLLAKAGLTFLVIGVGIATVLATLQRAQLVTKDPRETPLLVSATLTLVGYITFYRFNSEALHDWYASTYAIPLALFFGMLAGKCRPVKMQSVVAGLFFSYFTLATISALTIVKWPHQASFMEAGKRIARILNNQHRYASWNAGIIGYFSQKDLINIDGLVNDEVLPFLTQRNLPAYIQKRRIDTIVDYEVMFEQDRWLRRGGYDKRWITRCIEPGPYMDSPDSPRWVQSRLRVFSVRSDCLPTR